MPRITAGLLFTIILLVVGCTTKPSATQAAFPSIDDDHAALDALERLQSRGETLSEGERFRMMFNRPPFDDIAHPIASRLSQGRYPIADAHSNPRWKKASSCARCHEKEYKEWKRSLHSQAFTNQRFNHAFRLEPMAWCMNCHAPYWYEAKHASDSGPLTIQEIYQSDRRQYVVQRFHSPDRLPSYKDEYDYDDLRSEKNEDGVSCAVCHVRNDVVFTGRPVSRTMAERAKGNDGHELQFDPSLRSPDLCAGCHEFNFPDRLSPFVAYSRHPMQSTVSEFLAHRKSKADAISTCTGCHLRQDVHIASPLAHREAMQRVIQIGLHYEHGHLKMHIRIPNIGHPFPTGDLFRQARLRAFDENGRQLLDYRIARIVNNRTLRVESDTRLLPVQQSIDTELVFPLSERPTRCEVDYLFEGRIEHVLPKSLTDGERRIRLHDGACEIQNAERGKNENG